MFLKADPTDPDDVVGALIGKEKDPDRALAEDDKGTYAKVWFRTEEAAQGAVRNLHSRPIFQPWGWDKNATMTNAAELRQELAALIGFDDYASLSLATKMADSPAQVIAFLDDLATRAVPQAREEFNELAA